MMKPVYEFKNIQIEMTNACVHSCSNCTRFCGHHKKPFFMEWNTFKNAVDSLENWPRMMGIMGGEPTLHPEFSRFVQYAYEKHPSQWSIGGGELPRQSLSKYVIDANALKSGPLNKFRGLGLWSSVCDTYYQHYEQIQDQFIFQCVNDHTAVSRHQPWLITRKELGVPDEEWFELRDNCWWQRFLNSPSITPKGAFFCEVAAAMDILFDGPGGWKVEKDWWKRGPDDFKDQLHWCEMCSGALLDFDRDANEDRDDVSPIMYEKLKAVGSPKLKKGNVVLHTLDEKDEIQLSPRKTMLLYQDDDELRVTNLNKALYPKKIRGIIWGFSLDALPQSVIDFAQNECAVVTVYTDKALNSPFQENIMAEEEAFTELAKEIRLNSAWIALIQGKSEEQPFDFNQKQVVYNKGTFHRFPQGDMRLFHSDSLSLKQAGFQGVRDAKHFQAFEALWESRKIAILEDGFELLECPDYDSWVENITKQGVMKWNYMDNHIHQMALRRHILPKIQTALDGDWLQAFGVLDEICQENLPSHLLCDAVKKAVFHLVASHYKEANQLETLPLATALYGLSLVTEGDTQRRHLQACVDHKNNLCSLGADYLNSGTVQNSFSNLLLSCQALAEKAEDLVIIGMGFSGQQLSLILKNLGKVPVQFVDEKKEHFRFDGVRAMSMEKAMKKHPNALYLLSARGTSSLQLTKLFQQYATGQEMLLMEERFLVELGKAEALG